MTKILTYQSLFIVPEPPTNFQPVGWEIQSVQPPHPKYVGGSFPIGDTGTEAVYVFVPPVVTLYWGWEIQSVQPPAPYGTRSSNYVLLGGAGAHGDDGIERPLINWLKIGWEIPSYEPKHPRPEKAGSIMRGDDGTVAIYRGFLPFSFVIQLPQPNHPKPERAGGIMLGDTGIEAQLVPTVVTVNYLFESTPPLGRKVTKLDTRIDDGDYKPYYSWINFGWNVQDVQPPHNAPERRSAGIMRGIDGIESTEIVFYPSGWEVQPVQPPHIKVELRGAYLRGDDGTELPYQFQPPPTVVGSGWEIQSFQPPVPYGTRSSNYVLLGGAAARGDDGTESPLVSWYNFGWEIQSVQPPQFHGKPSATMRGIDGSEATLSNFYPAGWEIQSVQPPAKVYAKGGTSFAHSEEGFNPLSLRAYTEVQYTHIPHPRPEKSGSFANWFDGLLPPATTPLKAWWETQSVFPPRFRGKPSAIMVGDNGNQQKKINWLNVGWEVQPPQPPFQPSIKVRFGAIAPWSDGMNIYVYVPPVPPSYVPLVKFIGNMGNFLNR